MFSSDKESLLLSHLNWSVPELGNSSAGFGKRTHFAARYHGRSIRHQHNDRACPSNERLDPLLLCVVKPLEFVNASRLRTQSWSSHIHSRRRNNQGAGVGQQLHIISAFLYNHYITTSERLPIPRRSATNRIWAIPRFDMPSTSATFNPSRHAAPSSDGGSSANCAKWKNSVGTKSVRSPR